MENTVEKIQQVIESVRGFLQRDGGDIKFRKFEDGIVYVEMQGACAGCASIDATLYDGIESILMAEVPEVKGIVKVN
ncbi:NifU family protein [Mycoplasmatota bacterium WC44]